MLEEGSWRQPVELTIERAESVLGGQTDYVDIVVSVGLGIRNASMGYCRDKGYAFLWLEHFLKPHVQSEPTFPIYQFRSGFPADCS